MTTPHPHPHPALLTPNRAEAAALLGRAPLRDRADVEAAAQALHARAGQSVVITGHHLDNGQDDGATSDDYAVTPQASGWLSLPRIATPHGDGIEHLFAASAADALARGFVSIDAIILARMATQHALRQAAAAGEPTGQQAALAPSGADFALHSCNLPTFTLPGAARPLPGSLRFAPLSDPALGVYAVVDSADWVTRVLAAGLRTVQLRVKDANHPGLRDEVRRSVAAARAASAQLFINDHWQLALEEGAYGIHLGQEDLATADLAAIAAAGVRLGVSTHAYWEVCRAWALRPSYIACGPIHATRSKDMPWTPQGNGNLAYWIQLLGQDGQDGQDSNGHGPVPVVGIAGMDTARTQEAAQCGAASAAVITAITQAASPEAAIHELQQAFEAGRQGPRWPVPGLPQPTLR